MKKGRVALVGALVGTVIAAAAAVPGAGAAVRSQSSGGTVKVGLILAATNPSGVSRSRR